MKQWFPFTDYDFYAYLACGVIMIGGWDSIFNNNLIISSKDWTVPQIFVLTAISYLLGQIVAAPSSMILEHLVMHKLMHPPIVLILGLAKPSVIEKTLTVAFANHEYRCLNALIRDPILKEASEKLGHKAQRKDAEAIFQMAFLEARKNLDIANRIDQFRNLYGFARNASFSSLLIIILATGAYTFSHKFANELNLYLIFTILTVGMFGRFLKFYSAFTLEVLRGYSLTFQSSSNKSEYSTELAADQPSRAGAL